MKFLGHVILLRLFEVGWMVLLSYSGERAAIPRETPPGVRGVHGLGELPPEIRALVVEFRLPQAGQLSSASYEGDGFVIVRHPDTAVVTDALRRLVTTVRVELG